MIITAVALFAVGLVQAQDGTKKTETQMDMKAIQEMMKSLPGGGSMPSMTPVQVQPSYEFAHSVDMKVEMLNAAGEMERTFDYTMHMSKDADFFSLETTMEGMGGSTMIYEIEEHRMIMMASMNGNKMGMVHKVDMEGMHEMAENKMEMEDPEFKKSGKGREILGYECHEWTGVDQGHDYHFWMAEDPKFSFAKAYQEMAHANKGGKLPDTEYPKGMLMEMTASDAESGTKTIMSVTEIREDDKMTISTEGWSFMEMGGF